MTIQEALDIMCKRCENHGVCMGTGCAPKSTIENVIEKQIPKKPIGKYTCPKCGGRIRIQYYSEENEWTEWYVTFCPDCGQKIDWSDYDEN